MYILAVLAFLCVGMMVPLSVYAQGGDTSVTAKITVIKRMMGSELRSVRPDMQTRELLYKVMAYNYRTCMISVSVFLMISMEPWNDNYYIGIVSHVAL